MTEITETKKVLIVSTVSRQFYLFEQVNINILRKLGWQVHCAANFADASPALDELPIIRHHINFKRTPISIQNIIALFKLISLIKKEDIRFIHCHSPVGGVISRIAAFLTRKKVIYTAHGFHFYKGAPILNWLVFFPIEFILSFITDVLITINEEDYNRALKLHAKKNVYIPGIGVDTKKYLLDISFNRESKFRDNHSIPHDALVFITVGELIKRKNYRTALWAFSKVSNKNSFYLICGRGKLKSELEQFALELGISERVFFLGFRTDIPEILSISDIFIFPSYQEGLPVALMEAMAAGLPIICSEIRGNVDLIKNEIGGITFNPHDKHQLLNALDIMCNDLKKQKKMGKHNQQVIIAFNQDNVAFQVEEIYKIF